MAKVERSFHRGRLSFKAGKLGPDSDIGAVLASVSRPKLSSKLAPGPHDLGKLVFFLSAEGANIAFSKFQAVVLGEESGASGWTVGNEMCTDYH